MKSDNILKFSGVLISPNKMNKMPKKQVIMPKNLGIKGNAEVLFPFVE